jgi:hypothetical protein
MASELKVDKLSPATGTAFTLGDSGDTFTLPSGATIVNSGTATGFNTAGAFDLNGAVLTVDADADTTITADTDDQIDIAISGADDFRLTANTLTALSGSTIATNTIAETTGASGVTIDGVLIKDTTVDVDGTADAIILDGDGDTTISSPTDDQIDIEIAGADDFTFTANTFTAASGSTIAIAAGGAITNAGSMAPDISSTGKAMILGF